MTDPDHVTKNIEKQKCLFYLTEANALTLLLNKGIKK